MGRVDAVVRALVRGPLHVLLPGVHELTYVGPVSGRVVRLPVQAVAHDGGLVVLVGDADRKQWWRAFRTPHPVTARRGSTNVAATGAVLSAADPRRAPAAAAYAARTRVPVPVDAVLVLVA
ncbi:hypothetical protein [Cellulomonas sp. SLBN-39]|uniref:hypothetical protein n=1 Tax=Cellulomonas sp. SLBN-39 TaxID=2768446 RepID=UPI0011529B3A|nr:hypothetical protein [Cellulomonas sp. SLBN-39]TQL01072.1 hypothetical protein FBY24_0114 [Cellulomonas sp. SLBN-39]